MRNRVTYFLFLGFALFSCTNNKPPHWTFKERIPLGNISPVGITVEGKSLWLSDPDNNRAVKMDFQGNVLDEVPNLQRPMHIAFSEGKLFIPEYLTDTISVFENNSKTYLSVPSKINAPAGVAVQGNTIAIADFYNHRIIVKEGKKETIIGKEGHNPGELYYPTDVELHNDLIYVADAYNNRVQVFDKEGNSLQVIVANENIRVATGIVIKDEQLFVTDFEGNRVLIYDLDGNLQQILMKNLNKPADIVVSNNSLYVVNYAGKSITVFSY